MADGIGESPVRLACLGGSLESAVGRAHMTALAMDRATEVVAGCFSLSEDRNRRAAHTYGVHPERCYSNLETLLQQERSGLDAILILTPTDQHKEQVIQCLEAGLNVICEKALSGNGDDVRAIMRAERASGKSVIVTYNYLGYPMVRELRAMIAAGELGKVRQILIEMPQEGFLRKQADGSPVTPQAWRLRDGTVPTVSLDLGVHVHSLMNFLTGERPIEVVATQDSFGNFAGLVDNVVAISRCTGGLLGTTWFSKSALGFRNGLRVRVYGEKAAAEWAQEAPEYIAFADASGRRMTIDRGGGAHRVAQEQRYNRFKSGHPAGFTEAFANYYHDVVEALRARRDGGVSGGDYVFGTDMALQGALWLEALSRSATSSAWVHVDEG